MESVLMENQAIAETIALLSHYGFELEGQVAASVTTQWQKKYSAFWIRTAVLESLYRGRYKKVSVEEILRVWEKWGEPKFNFNHEFASLICAKLDCSIAPPREESTSERQTTAAVAPKLQPQLQDLRLESSLKTDGIERFQPQFALDDVSDAYQKLKAIAHQLTFPSSEDPLEAVEIDNKKP